MPTFLVRPNFPLLILVGIALVGALGVLIWRSWKSDSTSAAEQRALLMVALNAALAPALTLAVGLLLRPTLGEMAATAILSTVLSLYLLAKAHGDLLGRGGLYGRVRGLIVYYTYLFFLLCQFPQVHAVLTILLGDAANAHAVLLLALFLPAFAGLVMSRPSREEWPRWWPIRQWSALFMVGLLSIWMSRRWPS